MPFFFPRARGESINRASDEISAIMITISQMEKSGRVVRPVIEAWTKKNRIMPRNEINPCQGKGETRVSFDPEFRRLEHDVGEKFVIASRKWIN